MDWTLRAIGADELPRYASVPMTVEVRSVLEVTLLDGGFAGIALEERALPEPYVKDYDALGGPEEWPRDFDVSGWHIVVSETSDEVLGGAASFVEGEVATLWDIRVRPEVQRRGPGTCAAPRRPRLGAGRGLPAASG